MPFIISQFLRTVPLPPILNSETAPYRRVSGGLLTMLKVKSIKTEKHSQLQSHCYMRREDELALWGWGGGVGGAGATRMGRFNIWHPGTVQPPSYNPPTIVTSNGAPFRPFATSSLPLRCTHWTWNKRDRHIFKRIRLEHKQINAMNH